MRRALVVLVALVLLAGCGGGIKSGTVSGKQDLAAYDETELLPLFLGETCFKSGSSNICTPRYILVPYVVHYDEAFALHLRDCRADSGHCKTGTVYVSRDTYQAVSVGDYYRPQKDDQHRRTYEKRRK